MRHPCSAFVVCVVGLTLLAGCGGSSSDGSSPGTAPTTGGTSPPATDPPQTSSPPTITTQPASQTVGAGQTATFSVVASGASTLSYQWLGNGTAISGATSASYTTAATNVQSNGIDYTVTVSDSGGSVTSSAAVLTVTSPSCGAVPTAPGSITAAATSSSQINISWSASTAGTACVVTYRVYRGTTSGFAPTASNQVGSGLAATSFADTGLSASMTYYYLAVAADADGTSPPSGQASATTQAAASTGPGSGPGSGTAPTIATQPTSQMATIGTTATFTVVASGTAPFSYQWQKNGNAIAGATSASYNTPSISAPDNNAVFAVVVSNAGGNVTSANAILTVNSSPAYTIYPGFIGTDLNNNTHGAWQDDQIYIEILGSNVTTNALSWVSYDGTVTAAALADNTAANAITGPNGQTYPNYAFTLAQAKNLLQLPPLNGGRIFVSIGSPLYIPIEAGNPLGYAGPNPLNATDPNTNVHYDWYEFDWGGPTSAIFINTTQVDEFGLPMTLDVWGSSETFHQQTGITESIAALDQEFTAQTPATFQAGQSPISPLRIWAPAHLTFGTGGANGTYFDSYVDAVWAEYATTPLTVLLDNNSREFSGTTSGTTFNFTEVNLNNGAYGGAGTYTINEPTTQDILLCAGSMATGTGITAALEAQFCAAFNRHVMDNYPEWTVVADYYSTAPANYYSAFWHRHSIAGLSYGFAYDDVNNQSSSIVGAAPEHMAFGISW